MRIIYKDVANKIKAIPTAVKTKVSNGWAWTKENKDVLGYIFIPAFGSVVALLGMGVDLKINRDQFDMMDKRLEQFEDPETNVVFLLKRPMTRDEQIAVADWVRNKRHVEEILTELDLI